MQLVAALAVAAPQDTRARRVSSDCGLKLQDESYNFRQCRATDSYEHLKQADTKAAAAGTAFATRELNLPQRPASPFAPIAWRVLARALEVHRTVEIQADKIILYTEMSYPRTPLEGADSIHQDKTTDAETIRFPSVTTEMRRLHIFGLVCVLATLFAVAGTGIYYRNSPVSPEQESKYLVLQNLEFMYKLLANVCTSHLIGANVWLRCCTWKPSYPRRLIGNPVKVRC